MTNTSKARVLPDMASAAREIERLKAELEAAKAAATAGTKQTTVEVTELHGKPFLLFKGNFRDFTLSIPKCQRILDNKEALEAFVKSGGKATSLEG